MSHRRLSTARGASRAAALVAATLLLTAGACPGDSPTEPEHHDEPGLSFSPTSHAIVSGVPRIEVYLHAIESTVTGVEYQAGASPWLAAQTTTLPAVDVTAHVPLPGLPIGTHEVQLRATGAGVPTKTVTDSYALGDAEAIAILQDLGVIAPGAATNATLTRATLATMLVRLLGKDAEARLLAGAPSFADVPTTHWASGYIALLKNVAESMGFTIGSGDTFSPDASVTRAEVAGFLVKILGIPPRADLAWPDSHVRPLADAGLLPPTVTAQQLVAAANVPSTIAEAAPMLYQAWVLHTYPDGRTPAQTFLDASWRKW